MQREQEIFNELGRLCISPGYVHALAAICLHDNMVGYADEISGKDFIKKYSWDRLIRTEIMTLVGLMVKAPLDFSQPDPASVQGYINETYRLLNELHNAMSKPMFADVTPENLRDMTFQALGSGSVLREPIFYSGEAAYSFQLRDLAVPKYAKDNEWLSERKGFSIEAARAAVQAFTRIQTEKLTDTLHILGRESAAEWFVLEGFCVKAEDVAKESGYNIDTVLAILSSFALPEADRNDSFQSLHDFNVSTSTPLLKREADTFILFEQYSLLQALYDSPFYWMSADRLYRDKAMRHRGEFTENFINERLERVFGHGRVFKGVHVLESKGKELTEIDVLVLFGNRAIVVQAKSKKLTLEARRGNDGQIKADFQKAVQDAYDQGYEGALALTDTHFTFIDSSGHHLRIPQLKEVFIICVLSEPYPALSFQSRQFLTTHSTNVVRPPIVTDVFSIDAMTEMLDSPIWLMSYIHRRSGYSDKLYVPDELTALAYHLKANLWLDDKYDIVQLSDDISCDLDAAMTVRREGLPGKHTPDGILTKFVGSTIERILKQIESQPEDATLEFAFTVLTCDEETIQKLSEGIDRAAELSKRDGTSHNFMMSIGSSAATGVIVHSNSDPVLIAHGRLQSHCEKRKYIHKAKTWFGICINPFTKQIRFGIELEYPWRPDPAMEQNTKALLSQNETPKVGRNDQCPCGSGKKYKKCCLSRA